MKQYLIIFGPPGSGKGTQAENIAKHYGYFLFGTGDLMREEATKNTALGREFKKVWDKGEGGLVKEELVQQFVKEKIQQVGLDKNIIFDGYPRSVPQAEHLNSILKNNDYLVLNLEVTVEEITKRLQSRRICESCKKVFEKPFEKGITHCDSCQGHLVLRQEDAPNVILKRIEVYNQITKPVIDFYNAKKCLVNIDGNPPIENVFKEIQKVIEND